MTGIPKPWNILEIRFIQPVPLLRMFVVAEVSRFQIPTRVPHMPSLTPCFIGTGLPCVLLSKSYAKTIKEYSIGEYSHAEYEVASKWNENSGSVMHQPILTRR
jgi:hypothetical protein